MNKTATTVLNAVKMGLLGIKNYYIILLLLTLHITELIAAYCDTGVWKRVGKNSKYLVISADYWYNDYSYAEAESTCKTGRYNVPTINSMDDLRVIREYFKDNRQLWLDGTDAQEEGNWLNPITKLPITFQNFYALAPTNQGYHVGKTADHLILRWEKDPGSSTQSIVMHDHDGHIGNPKHIMYFCQFPATSDCYKESDEEKINRDTPDTLDFLGNAANNKYYIGRKQKTLAAAKSFCKSNSKFLMSLKFSSEKESDELYNLLTKWLQKNDLSRNSNGFHVDATETNLFQGDLVFNKRHYWQWVENVIADQKQDRFINIKKGLTRKFGKCLVVGTSYNNKRIFSLARTSCKLPYFFVCSDHKQNPDPTTTPRPHPSTTTEDQDPSTTTDNTPTTTDKTDPDDNYYKKYDAYLWEVIVV